MGITSFTSSSPLLGFRWVFIIHYLLHFRLCYLHLDIILPSGILSILQYIITGVFTPYIFPIRSLIFLLLTFSYPSPPPMLPLLSTFLLSTFITCSFSSSNHIITSCLILQSHHYILSLIIFKSSPFQLPYLTKCQARNVAFLTLSVYFNIWHSDH